MTAGSAARTTESRPPTPRQRPNPAPAPAALRPAPGGTAAASGAEPSAAWGGGTGRSRRLLTWSRQRRSTPAAPEAGSGTSRRSGEKGGGSWRRPELGSAARAVPSAAPARRHYRPTTDTERRRPRQRRRGAGRERGAKSREKRAAADLPNMAASRRCPRLTPAGGHVGCGAASPPRPAPPPQRAAAERVSPPYLAEAEAALQAGLR